MSIQQRIIVGYTKRRVSMATYFLNYGFTIVQPIFQYHERYLSFWLQMYRNISVNLVLFLEVKDWF